MNVSQENARASLSAAESVMVQTKKAIASSYANPSLIMWGILWILAYTITNFYYIYAFYIFSGYFEKNVDFLLKNADFPAE